MTQPPAVPFLSIAWTIPSNQSSYEHIKTSANTGKQDHKKAVKDEKREKRKEKIPKHIKKKLVSSSASRHKK